MTISTVADLEYFLNGLPTELNIHDLTTDKRYIIKWDYNNPSISGTEMRGFFCEYGRYWLNYFSVGNAKPGGYTLVVEITKPKE